MNGLLKLLTCGSVDDGKSTLIGHLLQATGSLYVDQEQALAKESAEKNSDGSTDYSLLLDGLIAEREQGITIDVAYRYFSTPKRSFIVADAPGHEAYTRNMAVGASFADLAVLLIDASRGIRTQTRRHLRICELMGIRHYLFAVNKMDLVRYDEKVFLSLRRELLALTEGLSSCKSCAVLPVCARSGDGLLSPSPAMPWYEGPALLPYLETVETEERDAEEGMLFGVQRVAFGKEGRRLQGAIACGRLEVGDVLTVYPTKESCTVQSLLVAGSPATSAEKCAAVSVACAEDLDISRGFVLAKDTTPTVGHLLRCRVLWMGDRPLLEGGSFRLKLAQQTVTATVMRLRHREDIDTGLPAAAKQLGKNEIGDLELYCTQALVFDRFAAHPALGRFLLIDPVSLQTAGCGTVTFPLRRADNLSFQPHAVTRAVRAEQLAQRPLTLWFTGLSGSGKSALAGRLEELLAAEGRHTMLLDGDNVRLGLNKDLGFTPQDRMENIRRVAEVARLMNDAGLVVLVAFISPFAEERKRARQIIGENDFVEIYVSTPLEECERRDVKGLYAKARRGEIPNFTGIGSPYEAPTSPDITIDTTGRELTEAAESLLAELRGFLE